MNNKNNRLILVYSTTVITVLAAVLSGCSSFSGERATEIEADRTLNNIARIRPVEDPNIGLPKQYAAPPRIVKQMVGGGEEWKLLYFAKYHTPDALKQMIDAQYAQRNYDPKDRVSTAPIYITSVNPACNQLLVRCASEQDINATLQMLEMVDVPPIQVRIECMIYTMYADLTVDRETTIQIQNLFGEGITLGGKTDSSGNLLPAFPGAALREVARSTFGLKIGYVSGKDGHWFQTLLDVLESKGYLKIMMNPTLEVVNGKPATIISKEKVPWQTISLETTDGSTTYDQYVWIIDQLTVTPHVFADGSIALETSAQIASKSTPEGVKQTPILTKRQITNKENRIRKGESLIIGGIRKPERRAIVRGIPGLKDIPGIGMLFSSKDFEERATETIFVLTPTISSGGVPNKEIIDQLSDIHEPPVSSGTLREAVADPFGFKAGQRQEQRELLETEQALLDAERKKSAQSLIDANDTEAKHKTKATENIDEKSVQKKTP